MSNTTIEERVVGLRFDGKDFEKNVKSSMTLLDKLNYSISGLKGSGAQIEFFASKIKGLTFDPLVNGAKISYGKIMALTAALTGVSNVSTEVYNKLTTLIRSVSADQVKAGFDKYGEYTNSMQTIMSATKQDGESDAEAMARVNDEMQKLLWFTDETSYNLTDMTSNVGKFTSQGIGLEESVTAMQGIALWAANAGQKSAQASRAMYNLSQSLGTGSVRLQDWMSIENANMATKEFKELAIQAGLAQGTLKKVGNQIQTIEGNSVSIENFRETLKDNWLNKEALMDVLTQYGEFAEKVRQYTIENDVTASQAIEALKKDGTAAQYALGAAAFEAGQQATTFTDAIDATRDAVSTQFLRIFQAIFGNYLEAKKLWTDFANDLWDVFAGPLDRLAEAFEWLHNEFEFMRVPVEVRETFLEIQKVTDKVAETFGNVFNTTLEGNLKNITKGFVYVLDYIQKFLDKNVLGNQKVWDNLTTFFTGIKSSLNVIKNLLSVLYDRVISKIFGESGNFIEAITKILAKIGEVLIAIDEYVQKTDFFNSIFDNIERVASKVSDSFGRIKKSITDTFEMLNEHLKNSKYISEMKARFGDTEEAFNIITFLTDGIIEGIDKITEGITIILPYLIRFWDWVKRSFKDAKTFFGGIGNAISSIVGSILQAINPLFNEAGSWFDTLKDKFTIANWFNGSPSEFLNGLLEDFRKFSEGTRDYFNALFEKTGAVTGFDKFLVTLAWAVETFLNRFEPLVPRILAMNKAIFGSDNLYETAWKILGIADAIAASILILVYAINVLKSIFGKRNVDANASDKSNTNVFVTGVWWRDLINLPANLTQFMKSMQELVNPFKTLSNVLNNLAKKALMLGTFAIIATALISLIGQVIILSMIPWQKLLIVSGIVLPAIAGVLIGTVMILRGITLKTTQNRLNRMMAIAGTMAILAGTIMEMALSIALLAIIPTEGLEQASIIMAILIFVVNGMAALMIKMTDSNQNASQMIAAAASVYAISKAVLIAANAMRKISYIQEEKLIMCGGVIAAMIILFGVIELLATEIFSNSYNVTSQLIALGVSSLLISASLFIAGKAMENIGNNIKEDRLKDAAIAILAIFGCMSLFLVGATALSKWLNSGQNSTGQMIVIGLLLLTMAGIMSIVGEAIKKVAEVKAPMNDIIAIAASLGGLLIVMGGVLAAASFIPAKNIGMMAAFGAIFSSVLLNVAGIIAALSLLVKDVNIDDLWQVIKALAVFMAVIIGIIGIFAMVGAVIWEKGESFGKAFVASAAIIAGILVTILMAMSLLLIGAAKLMEEMRLLGDMTTEARAKMELAMGSFASMVSTLLMIIINGIDEAITKTVEKSKLPDAIGFLFAKVMNTIEKYLPKTKVFLTKLTHTLGAYIKDNHEIIKESIILIMDDLIDILDNLISNGLPTLIAKLLVIADELFDAICTRIEKGWPRVKKIIQVILNDILFLLLKFRTDLVLVLIGSIAFALLSLKMAARGFGTTAVEIVALFLAGVGAGLEMYMPPVIADIIEAALKIIASLKSTIEEHADELEETMHFLLNVAFSYLASWVMEAAAEGGKLYNLGKNIARGIAAGVKAGAGIVGEAIDKIANNSVIRRFAERIDSNSPSKKFIHFGWYIDEGLAKGVNDKTGLVQKTITDLASITTGAFTETFGDPKEMFSGFIDGLIGNITEGIGLNGFNFDNILGDLTDMNPVITPELDLSLLEEQAGGIQSILGQEQLEAISGSFTAPQTGLDSVSMQRYLDGMQEQMQSYMDVQAYNNAGNNNNINVILDGDAKKMLKVVKIENNKQTKATNVNQLAAAK